MYQGCFVSLASKGWKPREIPSFTCHE
ncbi:hypothetical protein CIB84_012161 [Bambusicola thoracicus]|uniref:Uncharacterized protein n=1 Tax=Bambusicola thoracicus TaxID=9083 RepID=A0A2P4SJ06_BAMTH|nr:hypothetical protein CIB84_012161 [Bambusicola thoracicus]